MSFDGSSAGDGAGGRVVREVMRRDFVVVPADESLEEARRVMQLARLRHLLVERDGILVGILSYRDLQDEELERRAGPPPEAEASASLPPVVEKAMMESPYVVEADTSLAAAAARIFHLRIGCLPVVERTPEGPRLVGIVTEGDLLRAAYPVG